MGGFYPLSQWLILRWLICKCDRLQKSRIIWRFYGGAVHLSLFLQPPLPNNLCQFIGRFYAEIQQG